MRLANFFFPALAHAAVLERAVCNANNCARAVTGTRDKEPNLATRRELCSSFMLTTVTPDVTTLTITDTATATQTNTETDHATLTVIQTVTGTQYSYNYQRRAVTVSPSIVPPYASACSGSAAFSSACSCWGITAAVTTAPVPTAYTTITVTVTQTTSIRVTVTDATATVTTLHPVATLTADAQCRNGAIGCRANFPFCPGSATSMCLCGFTPQGQRQCFQVQSAVDFCTGHAPCTSNSDCSADNVCITSTSTCCGQNGDSVPARCWPHAYGSCVSEPARVRMMLRGDTAVPARKEDVDGPSPLWTGN